MSWNNSTGFPSGGNSSWGSSNQPTGQPQSPESIYAEGQPCTQSSQCASGYQCLNGRCVRKDELSNSIGGSGNDCGTGSGGPSYGGGSGSGGCGGGSVGGGQLDRCTTASPGDCLPQGETPTVRSYSSSTTGCGNPGGGGGSNRWNDDDDECDSFCEGWEQNFGDRLSGCPPPCPECEECSIFGECKKIWGSGCECDSSPPTPCAKCGRDGGWVNVSCDPPQPPKPSSACWYNSQCPRCHFCNSGGFDVAGECIPVKNCKRSCTEVTVATSSQSCGNWAKNGYVFDEREGVGCSGTQNTSKYIECGGYHLPDIVCGPVQCSYRSNAPFGCCVPNCGRNCSYEGSGFRVRSWGTESGFGYSRFAGRGKVSLSPVQCPPGYCGVPEE